MASFEISAQEDDIFKSLSDETIQKLDNIKELKKYQKGDFLFKEGHKQTGVFYIQSGSVKVFKNNKDGSNRIIYISRAGDLLGWERLAESSYTKDAIALEDTATYCFSICSFMKIMKSDSALSMEVIRYLCKGKLMLESKIFQNSLRQKLAANILMLIERFGIRSKNHIMIQVPLTKMDIAGLIGTNPETIIKLLSEFKKDQIIDFEDKKMLILNTEILQKLSNI